MNNRKVKKHVSFSSQVLVNYLDDDRRERISQWMTFAVDEMRFRHRIAMLSPILESVLTDEHRRKIYERNSVDEKIQ